MWPLIAAAATLALAGFLQAVDLEWDNIESAPQAYYSISTQNVLRCGKLCERQGRCVAATFDYRERMCHLHHTDVAIVKSGKSGGRYLFKKYEDNSNNYDHKFACDKDTQIAVPSVFNEEHSCYDIRAQYGVSYLGCYRDNSNRDLDGYLGVFEKTNSKALCTTLCYQSGYKYSGVQDANACLCGNSFGRYGEINESNCDHHCTGNATETCGGNLANSVYKTGL